MPQNILFESAIRIGQTILLYAVTGAGKTEMMFQSIQYEDDRR